VRDRLYRSRTDRMIFGVAGGMADWFDIDPSLVRLVWALLIVAGGVGLVLYIIAAIVIPEEPLGGFAGEATAAAGDPAAATGPATGAGAAGTAPGDDWYARRQARRAARAQRMGSGGGAIVFGLILIALGAWFLIDRYLHIDSALVLPGILIVLGVVLVVGALGRAGRG
jgi:phage shock protein C